MSKASAYDKKTYNSQLYLLKYPYILLWQTWSRYRNEQENTNFNWPIIQSNLLLLDYKINKEP